VALLSRRDFSRAELRGRLLRGSAFRKTSAAEAGSGDASAARAGSAEAEPAEAFVKAAEVERVLDMVQAQGLLSEQRFVDGFVRTRAGRFGPVRLRHELLRRGVEPERIDAALKRLQADEYANAQALWQKRFRLSPADARERARQSRFLAARGFSHDVIRRVLEER